MWRVITDPGSPKVIIIGRGKRYVFKVVKGRITREVWNALRALHQPILRSRIVPGWTVTVPAKHRGHDMTGENRRVILLTPPGKATVELRLVSPHGYVGRHIEWALRSVIEDREDPGIREAKMLEGAKRGGRVGSQQRLKKERQRLREVTKAHREQQKELAS